MRFFLLILVVLAAGVVLGMSVFTVDPTEFVYVTQFGEPVAVYDGGAQESDAGLHWRWPWPVQSVMRLDRRLQHFDVASTDFSTFDPEGNTVDKILVVEAFVCWRILGKDEDKDAVDRFVRRLGTPDQARLILSQRVNSQLGAMIGKLRMEDLISTQMADDGVTRRIDANMKELRDTVLGQLRKPAKDVYGIELVDIGLRRFNHPLQARETILARIRSEREKKAEEHRSDGLKQAADIRSESEEKIRNKLAQARSEEKIKRGEAETEADLIRNRAHAQDPEFYVFLKKLDKMHSILAENKTLLLLSTHRPIFDLLFTPPRPGAGMPAANGNGSDKNGPPPNPGEKKKN